MYSKAVPFNDEVNSLATFSSLKNRKLSKTHGGAVVGIQLDNWTGLQTNTAGDLRGEMT